MNLLWLRGWWEFLFGWFCFTLYFSYTQKNPANTSWKDPMETEVGHTQVA